MRPLQRYSLVGGGQRGEGGRERESNGEKGRERDRETEGERERERESD